MAQARRRNRSWVIWAGLAVVAGLAALRIGQGPSVRPADWAVRLPALLGYSAVFLASVASAYMPQMLRLFGRPFLVVHHSLALTGLALLTAHPLAAVLRVGSTQLLAPVLASPVEFLRWGGPVVWCLLVLAAGAAFLRRRLGRPWRSLHLLTYLGFWLGTAHALLLGGDTQTPAMRGLAIMMALAMVAVHFWRRRSRGRGSAGRAARA